MHSPDVVAIDAPFAPDARPRCDGLVTATPGVALGVTGADCGMILFADPEARVIGAAHAGWKGALTGVVEATVAAMARLGARAEGSAPRSVPASRRPPTRSGANSSRLSPTRPELERLFRRERKSRPGDVRPARLYRARAARAGIGFFEDSGLDTYADEARFFSYRRATHRKEPDYGRLVSAIALT